MSPWIETQRNPEASDQVTDATCAGDLPQEDRSFPGRDDKGSKHQPEQERDGRERRGRKNRGGRLVKPFARLVYEKTKATERKLGYGLEFEGLSSEWIDGQMPFELTPFWRLAGIKATGVNYFTMGAVKDGMSSRFDPDSPYYQAWLGGYVVRFDDQRDFSVKDHIDLAHVDQSSWLRTSGVKHPKVAIDYDQIAYQGEMEIDGRTAQLYQAGGISNTDVGKRDKAVIFPLVMRGLAQHFNYSNPNLHLTHQEVMPKWKDDHPLHSFQEIYLPGYLAIVDLGDATKAVLYANGARYTDKNGKEHDTFEVIKDELRSLLSQVKIAKTEPI